MKKKTSAVYKITNEVTGDFYIGSSVDVFRRWNEHKQSSTWKRRSNSKLYEEFQKYGLEHFRFQIIVSIMPECLRSVEQDCIELMKPAYNNYNAKGRNFERYKATQKTYEQSEKRKGIAKEYRKKYRQTNKYKEYIQSDKYKECRNNYNQSEKCKEARNKYYSQLCNYNGETLTLRALESRFVKAGIEHPTLEAKKYLLEAPN